MKSINSLSIIFLICYLAFVFKTQSAFASNEFGLFSSDETLDIFLKTDLKWLIKAKSKDDYLEGDITVEGKTYPIRLRSRGNNRLENCNFPPMTLNFKKTQFEDESFEQLKELKLVNVCNMQKTY